MLSSTKPIEDLDHSFHYCTTEGSICNSNGDIESNTSPSIYKDKKTICKNHHLYNAVDDLKLEKKNSVELNVSSFLLAKVGVQNDSPSKLEEEVGNTILTSTKILDSSFHIGIVNSNSSKKTQKVC